jgi:branched-chain amino acid transport system ATP-binding protein
MMEQRKDPNSTRPDEDPFCLVVEDLSKKFGGLDALSQVNLKVREGERRGIIGPNGAGKTTFFNLISGELLPTSGKISLFGKDITHLPAHRRAYLGISRTFQITNLFPKLTVLQNLILAAQALEKTKFIMLRPIRKYHQLYRRADEILERVGMTEKRKEAVKNLSHGEQRQVEIGMALLGEPRLLLLDEPTAGLAPAESAMMVSMVKTLEKTMTILIIEHDMDVAYELTDFITVLNFGKVLAEGNKEDIQSNKTVQEVYLGTG